MCLVNIMPQWQKKMSKRYCYGPVLRWLNQCTNTGNILILEWCLKYVAMLFQYTMKALNTKKK